MELRAAAGTSEWKMLRPVSPAMCVLQLSQQQIDVRALQQAGSSKKARSGVGGTGNSDSALRRNSAMPITSFFSKAQH